MFGLKYAATNQNIVTYRIATFITSFGLFTWFHGYVIAKKMEQPGDHVAECEINYTNKGVTGQNIESTHFGRGF